MVHWSLFYAELIEQLYVYSQISILLERLQTIFCHLSNFDGEIP